MLGCLKSPMGLLTAKIALESLLCPAIWFLKPFVQDNSVSFGNGTNVQLLDASPVWGPPWSPCSDPVAKPNRTYNLQESFHM